MKDKTIGKLVFIIGLLLALIYLYLLRTSLILALAIPVITLTYTVFLIICWMGYTMMITPPPMSLSKPVILDDE